MNTEEIYELADKLTEQQVKNIINEWTIKNETKKTKLFESLVRLGDSRQLACATVMLKENDDKEVLDSYRFAYES